FLLKLPTKLLRNQEESHEQVILALKDIATLNLQQMANTGTITSRRDDDYNSHFSGVDLKFATREAKIVFLVLMVIM
ncbi:hypothetical protein J1N35_024735, partial [Gossypium stocksii]